jgi:hypothetical protein
MYHQTNKMDPYVRTLESMIIALLARRQQYIDEESDLMPDPWSKLRVMMKTVIIRCLVLALYVTSGAVCTN